MSETNGKADHDHKQNKHEIFIDGKKFEVQADFLNGAQIKALAGIQSDYQLFLEKKEGDDEPIPDLKSIKLENGMHFFAIPPATFG